MLSRCDIEKELFGKGLSIYPLNPANIKENSINVTISKYAWCQSDLTVYWYGEDNFSIKNNVGPKIISTKHFKKGEMAIFVARKHGDFPEKLYLLLFPHQATIIETEEVIGIGNQLGGAVHSKVGIVSQGVGDTGTMLGPGYCGHLMITLHNITDDIIALPVGTTFVSLTFSYLNTQVIRTSTTSSSHYDRLLEHGCILNSDEKSYFTEDWKSNFGAIQEKMQISSDYKNYIKQVRRDSWKQLRKYINKKNILAIVAVVAIFFALHHGAQILDSHFNQTVWVDRFWNVGCSGLVGTLLIGFWRFLTDKK